MRVGRPFLCQAASSVLCCPRGLEAPAPPYTRTQVRTCCLTTEDWYVLLSASFRGHGVAPACPAYVALLLFPFTLDSRSSVERSPRRLHMSLRPFSCSGAKGECIPCVVSVTRVI